jgi:heptose-I-phosphate ethanolaminephosphotransferase
MQMAYKYTYRDTNRETSSGATGVFGFLAAPLRREPLFFVFMYAMFVVARIIESPASGTPACVLYFENIADLYILCALLRAVPRRVRPWLRGVLYGAGYLAAFAECFIHVRFHLLFGPITVQLLSETTPGESAEFLSAYFRGGELAKLCLVFVPLILANIAAGISAPRLMRLKGFALPRIAGSLRAATDAAAVACVALCFVLSAGEKAKMVKFFASRDTAEAERCDSHAFHTPVYRMVFSAKFLSLSAAELERVRSQARSIRVDSCSRTVRNIVLYIGESYNKHHSQLYGYALPTTPRQKALADKGELVVMRNAVTPWNVTSNVFKEMLSTHASGSGGSWADGALLPGVMRKAGYKVAFITSQYYKSPNLGVVDFNGSFFLNDSELSRLCFDFRNRYRKAYDASLLKELDKFPRDSFNFVIFHGMGQHQEYSRRFRPGDVHFTAADYAGRSDLSRGERQIVADYDNATLYNDKVMARLCRRFRDEDAIVVYVADHGEEVFDRMHTYGRDHDAAVSADIAWSEFEVPMVIWFSPQAASLHAGIYRAARRAADRPFLTADMPQLLMGLAGISSPLYDERRDLLAPAYDTRRKRMLKNSVDYDSLMNRSARNLPKECKTKGKPKCKTKGKTK